MFDSPFDVAESSHAILPSTNRARESQHSNTLLNEFDRKLHRPRDDIEAELKSLSINDNTHDWNDDLVDNQINPELLNRKSEMNVLSRKQSQISISKANFDTRETLNRVRQSLVMILFFLSSSHI